MRSHKKTIVAITLGAAILFGSSFVQKHEEEKFTNLKILPKNITEKELDGVMKSFSRSLGVRCNFCHVSEAVEGQQHPRFDFASDAKPEKNIARNMWRMTQAINENYLAKMIGGDHPLETIACVTCHMGRTTPIVSIDSLAKRQ